MPELNDAIADVMAAFQDFKTEQEKRFETLEARMKRPGAGGSDYKADAGHEAELKALGAFCRGQDGYAGASEFKGLVAGVDPSGGYITAPAISQNLMMKIFDQSPFRRLVRVETISQGAWQEPFDGPDDVGATWVGETESRPETDNPSVKLLDVTVEEIYALQSVTQRLLDDSYVNIGAWLENRMADKFARSEGAAVVNGNGIAKPSGFLGYSTDSADDSSRAWKTIQYTESGAATQITADALRDLYWSLRAPYRPNATWVMSSATANSIDKLKDGNGDYLWRDGMTAGAPPSLLGRPVEFSEDMPAIGAGTFPIAFADWRRAYVLVDHAGVRFLRDPYSSKPKVLFYAYRRTGGACHDFEAIKLMKVAAS